MSANSSKIHILEVLTGDEGERADRWLAKQKIVSSRSRAAELIAGGHVRLNGRTIKSSQKVSPGQFLEVEIPAPPPSVLQPLDAPLDVLYEDEDLIVVNKPAGLVVHPAAGHAQDTLVNILLHHTQGLSMGFGEHRPGIVHRIDRDTSGILVVAKTDLAHHHLAKQFKDKSVHRIYWAIVAGVPKQKSGSIKTHLARHPSDRKRFASTQTGSGKLAITHYRILDQRANQLSWIECRLETGRTHQIRVHLSELGHPILGDPIYGGKFKRAAPRLALHAVELGFEHPRRNTRLSFRVPWPDELAAVIAEKGLKHV